MDFETINKDLRDKFNKPYREFYDRRIVFWIDEEGEFKEDIDSLDLGDVKLLKLNDRNQFTVKKVLNVDDRASDVLVYVPVAFENVEDNWIRDMMLYSEWYRADRLSIQLDEMNLDPNLPLRPTVKAFHKFFNAKGRRERVKKFSEDITNPSRLVLAIMATIASSEMDPEAIFRAVFKKGLENDGNSIYSAFVQYEVDDSFWLLAEQGTGYAGERKCLYDLFQHILLTASSRTVDRRAFDGLEAFISTPHEDFCFQLVHNWIRDSYDRDVFKALAMAISDDIALYDRLMALDSDAFYLNEIFPCVDEAILAKMLVQIRDDIFDLEGIFSICEKRRVSPWYGDFNDYYEAIFYIGKMKEFYNHNQNSFHMASAEEVWKAYADKFYVMDTFYRKFQKNYQLSLRVSNSNIDDLMKSAVARGEGIYKHWFLERILGNWESVSGEDFKAKGYIPSLDQQVDFYKDHVSPMDSKVFVVISDAMRYEVAKELSLEMERELQGKVSIETMEGVFPTITSYGMAALLPNNGLEVRWEDGNLKVLIDGESTEMPNREKVLQSANPMSKVLRYDDFIHMKKAQRRDHVKGMDVVYIYHDQIDKTSHSSENDVFYACDKAIDEIKNLLRILIGDLSAINVLITSDHGFLYTYEDFKDDSKVANEVREDSVEYGRRYVISRGKNVADYLMPINFERLNRDLMAFAPRNNTRIKKHGGGINFVHGGISLQEKMVPLIKYKHLRNDSKEYQKNREKYDAMPVELYLLSTGRKISNMVFNLSFYQKEMLSANREAASFVICFEDEDGVRISDEVRIIADKNGANDKDRIFNVTFHLNAGRYHNRKTYYLKIYEKTGALEVKDYEFTIDIPFESRDLDFFS